MTSRTILITGGAGFIGSALALHFRSRRPSDRIIALDNLRRRGVEVNVPRLRRAGVEFVHGDVREYEDLEPLGDRLDVLVECSAEPSVLAGYDGRPRYVVDTNLSGCVNCLELARRSGAALIFLSTSRVYPTEALRALQYDAVGSRFVLNDEQRLPGVGKRGVSEEFPLSGARTLYGATKLAAELVITEYADMFDLRAVVNRCGVVSGPWQMGHAEQGVFAHWVLAHAFRSQLAYIGFGGKGHQVRDVLHVADLASLLDLQIEALDGLAGDVFNVGGGPSNSTSLLEFSEICTELSGEPLHIGSVADTRPGDVPIYVSDTTKVEARFDWRPRLGVRQIAAELFEWVNSHRALLGATLP